MTKKFYLILFVASFAIVQGAFSQIRKIPPEVTNTFSDKYPGAKNVAWQDELKDFKASFTLPEGGLFEAKFSTKGEWKVTEKEIAVSNIPDPIKEGLSKSLYADWSIRSVYILYFPVEPTEYHIIVAKTDINKKNLLFNKDGRLLRDNFTF